VNNKYIKRDPIWESVRNQTQLMILMSDMNCAVLMTLIITVITRLIIGSHIFYIATLLSIPYTLCTRLNKIDLLVTRLEIALITVPLNIDRRLKFE